MAIAATKAPAKPARTERTRGIRRDLKQLEGTGGRVGSDTLRLWEFYREQALLWRAMALLQMPATCVALIAAVVMFFFADIHITVPQNPVQSRFNTRDLADEEYVGFATHLIGLIGTYQPSTAGPQFFEAVKYLWEPALSAFVDQYLKNETGELATIKQNSRTQMFFIDESLTKIERHPEEDYVVVRLFGYRKKLIQDKPIDGDEIVYYVKMGTVPHNILNKFGIVAFAVEPYKQTRQQVLDQDYLERFNRAQEQMKKEAEARK